MNKLQQVSFFLSLSLPIFLFSCSSFNGNREISSIDPSNCLPFFDNVPNPRPTNVVTNYRTNTHQKTLGDLTPPPNEITQLDRDIMNVCKSWGSAINPQDFSNLIDKHPEIYKPFEQFLSSKNVNTKNYIKNIWLNHRAFEHIFCGQPKGHLIGGLHYWARYYYLQTQKLACMMPNNSREELLPQKVFTVGVLSNKGDDELKGYAINQSALDFFHQATEGYIKYCEKGQFTFNNLNSKGNYNACLMAFKDKSFYSQFVCNPDEGIVTMYPYAGYPHGKQECR